MKFLKLAKKNKEFDIDAWDKLLEIEIVRKIRSRYSINQELAILRQRDSKPEEFREYSAYVEQCKTEAKKEMEV